MKVIILLINLFLVAFICSCGKIMYKTNGEAIYKTGRNVAGEKLLDRTASRIKIVNSCKTCHGKNGDAMKDISIKFSSLSNPNNFAIPYNDSLFFRFLDRDLKSDGTKANIGVIWKISDKDKKDLLNFLKSL
jgi:hypothetical protein